MRLNKYEQNILRAQRRKRDLSGTGLFVYRNNTKGELFLPRPTKSGVIRVAVNEEFQGDDYYMFMLRNNELRLVRQIEPSQVAAPPQLNEGCNMDNKLITEQPPVVTNEGTVEYVEKQWQKLQKINEDEPSKPQDVLLNEIVQH